MQTCTAYSVKAQQHERRNDIPTAVRLYRLAWQAGKQQGASDDYLYGIARLYWARAAFVGIDTSIGDTTGLSDLY